MSTVRVPSRGSPANYRRRRRVVDGRSRTALSLYGGHTECSNTPMCPGRMPASQSASRPKAGESVIAEGGACPLASAASVCVTSLDEIACQGPQPPLLTEPLLPEPRTRRGTTQQRRDMGPGHRWSTRLVTLETVFSWCARRRATPLEDGQDRGDPD